MSDLTIKQEKFCHKYIETGNASEAYRQCYDVSPDCAPETIWVNASKLLADANVSQRVKELVDLSVKKHFVTVDTLTNEYEEIRSAALAEKQFSPAVSAVTGKAKLHGHLTDKHEMTGKDGGPIETKDITGMEFARRAAFLFAQASKELENGNQRTDDGLYQEKEKPKEQT